MSVFDLKHATITLEDGNSHSTECKIGSGNITFDPKRNIIYDLDKGLLDTTREGDEVPMDVSLDIKWEYIESDGGEPVTPYEAITQTGAASAWTSSDTADPCGPYAVNIIITYAPPCSALTNMNEVITLGNFRWEGFPFDGKAGTLKANGKCNVKLPTILRTH